VSIRETRNFAVPLDSIAPKLRECFRWSLGQQRSLDVTESREYYLVVTVEPQRELVRQVLSRVRRTDDAAAGRDDRVGRFIERRSQRLEFTRTKSISPASRRYCAAATPCGGENVVGVDGLAVPERSERSSDRGLSGAGETDEDEAAHG